MLKNERRPYLLWGEVTFSKGIALSVGPAQCVAILGRNGAGKTTTFALDPGSHACPARPNYLQGDRYYTVGNPIE